MTTIYKKFTYARKSIKNTKNVDDSEVLFDIDGTYTKN